MLPGEATGNCQSVRLRRRVVGGVAIHLTLSACRRGAETWTDEQGSGVLIVPSLTEDGLNGPVVWSQYGTEGGRLSMTWLGSSGAPRDSAGLRRSVVLTA